MADGLDLNLEGMSEDQLRAAQDFQNRLRGVRAARMVGATPAPAAPQIMNTTAQSAARATAGPAVGAAPTATNIAPMTTANAAAVPGIGSRIMAGLRGAGRLFGGAQAAVGGYQAAKGDYGNAADNMFQGAATAINPLVGTVGNLLTSGRDAVMRFAIDKLYGENKTFLPQPAGAPGGPVAPSPTPINAERLMTGTGVPETGTGAFRVGRRAAVAVDSRGTTPASASTEASAAAAQPKITMPTLGTEGGVFGNLVQFTNQASAAASGISAARGQAGRAKMAAELGFKGAELGLKAEDTVSNRMKALADLSKAGQEGKKTLLDLQGNPIIVDTKEMTAVKPNVNPQLTESTIRSTAEKRKMTPQQVLQRLLSEGRISPSDPLFQKIQ